MFKGEQIANFAHKTARKPLSQEGKEIVDLKVAEGDDTHEMGKKAGGTQR
jgi:hypothetical protein